MLIEIIGHNSIPYKEQDLQTSLPYLSHKINYQNAPKNSINHINHQKSPRTSSAAPAVEFLYTHSFPLQAALHSP